jgi:thiol-disulfide isomerase/thioredoxin
MRSRWLFTLVGALAMLAGVGLWLANGTRPRSVPPTITTDALFAATFHDTAGVARSLADFRGKVLVLNFWATWCAPCRAEMPALDALQREKGSDRFEVVAVNVDTGDDAKPKKFLAETGIEALAAYRDATMGVFNDLKKRSLALGLPVTLLVDPQGCLLANMNGPADWGGADAAKLVEAALGS